MNPNLAAFLRVIRAGESSQDDSAYTIVFGGGHFPAPPWTHPNRAVTIGELTSTAAGAYQFLYRTWAAVAAQQGLQDFSPANQDKGACALIAGRGALEDVLAGRFEAAIAKCGKEWASLPGSPYGQPTMTIDKARSIYLQYGGALDSAPTTATPIVTPRKGTSMPIAALIATFGPMLADLIPQVAKLFSSGSEVATRNVAAAQAVFDTVVKASGQPNIQAAVEAMSKDDALKATVQQAVVTDPIIIGLLEVGGGIQAARAANLAIQNSDKGFWLNPAFWVTGMLFVFPLMLSVDVFWVHSEAYDGNIRTQIVTAILAVLTVGGGYWLGSSVGSAKKDETINQQTKG